MPTTMYRRGQCAGSTEVMIILPSGSAEYIEEIEPRMPAGNAPLSAA